MMMVKLMVLCVVLKVKVGKKEFKVKMMSGGV